MENKKLLEFQTSFDTTDFDKSVESMQKRLKALTAESDISKLQTQTNQRLQAQGQAGQSRADTSKPQDQGQKATVTPQTPQQTQQFQQVKEVFQRFVQQLQQLQYNQKTPVSEQKQQVIAPTPNTQTQQMQPGVSAPKPKETPKAASPAQRIVDAVDEDGPQARPDNTKQISSAFQGFVKQLQDGGEPEKAEQVRKAFKTYSEESKDPTKATAAYDTLIKQVQKIQPKQGEDDKSSAKQTITDDFKRVSHPDARKVDEFISETSSDLQKRRKEIFEKSDAIDSYKNKLKENTSTGQSKEIEKKELEAKNKADIKQGKDDLALREKIKKLDEEINELAKKNLEIKQKIAETEKTNYELVAEYKERDKLLNQAIDLKEKIPLSGKAEVDKMFGKDGQGGGNLPPPAGGAASGIGGSATFAAASKAMGLIAAILGGGAEIYKQVYESDFKTKVATGSAIQNTVGRELEGAYSGRTPYEMAFMGEKGKAFDTASKLTEKTKTYDQLRLATGMAGLAATGTGLAASGIVAASGVGIPAAAWGAATSAGVGALSMGALAGNERMRSLSLGTVAEKISQRADMPRQMASELPLVGGMAEKAVGAVTNPVKNFFGDIATSQQQQYTAHLAEDFASNFQKALQAEKDQNPLKRLAAEEYQNSFMRNLNFQRSTGLDYEGFHGKGGFREQNVNAGFTDQMGMEQSQGIMSAGGSTRMARESSFGLKLQRGADLTNSAGVLGSLSSSLGSAESTKQATIKILAEGMRLGLDQSQFAEENRKFVQATAEIVSRSGAKGDTDIERVISQFGKFQNENTTKGIEGARGAYETYQQAANSTEGPQGAIRAAGFIKDKVLGNLSAMDRAALASVPMEQLGEDHPVVQDIARRTGETPQSIVDRTKKVSENAIHRLAKGDQLTDNIKKTRNMLAEAQGKGTPGGAREAEQLQQQLSEQKQQLSTVVAVEYPALAGNRKQLESFVEGSTSNDPENRKKAFSDLKNMGAINDKLEKSNTGRVEDDSVKALAESSRLMVENFRDFHKEIIPTLDSVRQFNSALRESVKQLMALPEGKRGSMANDWFNLFSSNPSTPAPTQNQTGKTGK